MTHFRIFNLLCVIWNYYVWYSKKNWKFCIHKYFTFYKFIHNYFWLKYYLINTNGGRPVCAKCQPTNLSKYQRSSVFPFQKVHLILLNIQFASQLHHLYTFLNFAVVIFRRTKSSYSLHYMLAPNWKVTKWSTQTKGRVNNSDTYKS